MNLFYAPDIKGEFYTLTTDESKHIIRVLRMKVGDPVHFTDGKGSFYDCEISDPNPKACQVKIKSKYAGEDKRNWQIQLAVAPTKNINRFEWFLEKATEIGIDSITPIICNHSERKEVKFDRLNRVIVAAMKQSLKSKLPVLTPATSFEAVMNQAFEGEKYIAYIDKENDKELSNVYTPGKNAMILIGPEGDFSLEEVEMAKQAGFVPVRLGKSRLRTETAAVVACHTIHLINQ